MVASIEDMLPSIQYIHGYIYTLYTDMTANNLKKIDTNPLSD